MQEPSETTVVHITTVPQSLTFVRGQARFMKEHGFHLEAISSPGERLDAFSRDENVQTYGVEMERNVTPHRDIKALSRIVRVLKKLKPEIVHGHTPKGGLLAMMGGFLARIPVRIYTLHGLWYVSGLGWKRHLIRGTERLSCALAHSVLTVSESVRQQAIADGLCSPDKIKVIGNGSPNGIDAVTRFNPDNVAPGKREEIRTQLGIPQDAFVIGFVGRIFQVKGVVELEEAWQRLREEYLAAHLMLVGAPDLQRPIPDEVNQRLHSDDRVHFTGSVRNTPDYYSAMDLFVLPSYQEGFGVVLIEAAAMRLPTVSTEVLGCVDAVEDGVTGTLVPAKDSNAVYGAISRYIDDPALRRAHGAAGRKRALQSFRPELAWEFILEEYLRLLRRRRGAQR